MIGACNITYFISNGQQCQKSMITNLQTLPNTNCSYEYENEKKCLRGHIVKCLTGQLSSYVNPVKSLLLHQLYHCGDLKYQPSVFNGFILKTIECKQEAFMDTEFCWRYFRDRLNANRSDPLLCREYALAKECITEKAKASCKICEYLKRDTYNPFCPNNTDPVLYENDCQDVMKPLSCSAYSTYKMALDCEKKFLTALLGKENSDCSTPNTALVRCLDDKLSASCQDYGSNQRLKDDIQKAVSVVLRGRRFFCEQVSVRAIDLDVKVRPLFPCSAEFIPEMEKCALPIREGHRSQKSTQLCRNFQAAVNCSNAAQKSYCKFKYDVGAVIQDTYKSFCGNGNGGIQGGAKNVNGATPVAPALYLTALSLFLLLIQGNN